MSSVIGSDFTGRLQIADDPDSRRLRDALSSFDMVQYVSGNTLDLVITFAGRQLSSMSILPVSSQTMRSLLAVSCADGDVLTAMRFDDCSKSVHCANRYRSTQMSTSYSRLTMRCCVTLRTNWHRRTLSVVPPADRRRGSTLSVEQNVVNVDVSSAVTAIHGVQRIAGSEWRPRVADCDCTSRRTNSIG